jgi:hypothetical protein
MDKDDAVKVMLDSINADNLKLSINAGISEEQAKKNIADSQESLHFMMSNIYDSLVNAQVITKTIK